VKPSPLTSPALATENPLKSRAATPSSRKPMVPSSDDSGMTAGNSDARATGVHAVEARTARTNMDRCENAEFPDLTELILVGIVCTPVADLHEQTLGPVFPGRLAVTFIVRS